MRIGNWLKFLGVFILTLLTFSFFSRHGVADSGVQPGDVDFLSQVLNLIQSFGGLPWVGKISAIVLLIVASMKVSFLQPVWKLLGAAQGFVAPVLGLVAGVLNLHPFSWAGLMAYISAGAGALILHELLDAVKGIPGIGAAYVAGINWVEGLLGGGASS